MRGWATCELGTGGAGGVTILFLWEMPSALRSLILAIGIDCKCLVGSVLDFSQFGGSFSHLGNGPSSVFAAVLLSSLSFSVLQ